jgi:hypothetical protein
MSPNTPPVTCSARAPRQRVTVSGETIRDGAMLTAPVGACDDSDDDDDENVDEGGDEGGDDGAGGGRSTMVDEGAEGDGGSCATALAALPASSIRINARMDRS